MIIRKHNKIFAFLLVIGLLAYLAGNHAAVYAEEVIPTPTPPTPSECYSKGLEYDEESQSCIVASMPSDSKDIDIVKENIYQNTSVNSPTSDLNYGYRDGTWSIVNLLFALMGLLLSISAFVLKTYRERTVKNSLFMKSFERKKAYMYCNLFIALCGVALFALTQRFSENVVLIDEFSGMFLFFMLANIFIYFAYCKWYEGAYIYN